MSGESESETRDGVAIDPEEIDLLRYMYFDTVGEPIYALMVTGKDARPPALAANAIISFLAQTYGNRHLVVVNDGNYEFRVAGPAAERVVQIAPPKKERLGALRNRALDCIPRDALWVQWDDDDWHHPSLVASQHDVLQNRGVAACFLRWQIKYVYSRNTAWADPFGGGFAGTLMTRNFRDVRYPDDVRGEDTVYGAAIKERYEHCDWDNPPEYYLRFIHGNNTWPESHFHLEGRVTDEWRMSVQSANYLRAILPLYRRPFGAPQATQDSVSRLRP